jgi:hypothetical protein
VVLISLLMLAMWRSFTAAWLSMLPNLAPVLLIFIIMGALGIWLVQFGLLTALGLVAALLCSISYFYRRS